MNRDEKNQRQMDFILEQQAKHETEMQDFRWGMQQLQQHQNTLTESLTMLALQSDRDREHIRATLGIMREQAENDRQEMRSSLTSLDLTVTKMAEQAEKDRQEMRISIAKMEAQAEKDRQDIRNAMLQLAKTVGNVHTRVERLEEKAS